MRASCLIIGLILIAVAVLMFVLGEGNYAIAGAVALAVLGLVSIAYLPKKVVHDAG